MISATRQFLQRLWRAQEGVAAVEFALILPLMLFTYLGTVEASTLISMDRKVQSVAGTVGDLVARSDQSIQSSLLRDYFRASRGIMTPYEPGDILQVVTAVSVSSTGVPTVVWSRQFQHETMSATTPHRPGTRYPLPQEMIDISRGMTVIAAEASYPSYTPLFGVVFDQPINLFRSNFFLTRFGSAIAIVN